MADTSTAFRLLADDTRRRLLVQLYDRKSVEVPEGILVRSGALSASSRGDQRDGVGRESPHRETVDLYHHHLPKLESHGVIEWNQETGIVSRGAAFEEIEPLLEILTDGGLVAHRRKLQKQKKEQDQ